MPMKTFMTFSFMFMIPLLIQANNLNIEKVGSLDILSGNFLIQNNLVYGNFGNSSTSYSPLGILSLADPVKPELLGSVQLQSYLHSISKNGSYIYTVDEVNDVLSIVDVENPSQPKLLKTITDLVTRNLFVRYNYLYLLSSGSLNVYDISDPLNLEKKGQCSVPNDTHMSIFVQGNYAYTTAGAGGNNISVVDISNPSNPQKVGSCTLSNYAYAYNIYVQGSRAYVTTSACRSLNIIDVTTPTLPTEIGVYKFSNCDGTIDACIIGRFAIVTAITGGIRILDVSNPESPKEVAYDIPVNSADMMFYVGYNGKYIYVSTCDKFYIYRSKFMESTIIKDHILGLYPLPDEVLQGIDENNDGIIDVADIIKIMNE